MWKENAYIIETFFGGEVNWEERYYICPECGDCVYEKDWDGSILAVHLCPICEFEEGEVLL